MIESCSHIEAEPRFCVYFDGIKEKEEIELVVAIIVTNPNSSHTIWRGREFEISL